MLYGQTRVLPGSTTQPLHAVAFLAPIAIVLALMFNAAANIASAGVLLCEAVLSKKLFVLQS